MNKQAEHLKRRGESKQKMADRRIGNDGKENEKKEYLQEDTELGIREYL